MNHFCSIFRQRATTDICTFSNVISQYSLNGTISPRYSEKMFIMKFSSSIRCGDVLSSLILSCKVSMTCDMDIGPQSLYCLSSCVFPASQQNGKHMAMCNIERRRDSAIISLDVSATNKFCYRILGLSLTDTCLRSILSKNST